MFWSRRVDGSEDPASLVRAAEAGTPRACAGRHVLTPQPPAVLSARRRAGAAGPEVDCYALDARGRRRGHGRMTTGHRWFLGPPGTLRMSACEIFRQAEQATGAGSLETRAIRRSASHSQRQHRSLALNQAANLSAGCEVEQTIEVLASSEKSMACCERSNHNWGSSEIWCRLEGCDTSIRVLVHERRWGWASQAAGGPAFAGLCLRVSDQRGTRQAGLSGMQRCWSELQVTCGPAQHSCAAEECQRQSSLPAES